MKKKSMKASITVEAAFVMPLVICVIFSFLYLIYYLYDTIAIQSTIDHTLHKAIIYTSKEADFEQNDINYEEREYQGVLSSLFRDRQSMEEMIEAYCSKELEEKLFLVDISSIDVNYKTFKVEISVYIKGNLVLPTSRYFQYKKNF